MEGTLAEGEESREATKLKKEGVAKNPYWKVKSRKKAEPEMDPAAVRTKAAEVLAKQRQLEKEKLQKQQQVSYGPSSSQD
jgi:hypothetical protein